MTAIAVPSTARELARNPGRLRELTPTAIAAFRDIARHWALSPLEQRIVLGILPQSTFTKYMRDPAGAALSYDTLQRISHLYGVFKAINVLLADERLADEWISRPNDHPLFKGATPKDVMLDGALESIVAVREYLDAERGW
jgi:uncharacterized protein (DUF2384 family)